MDNNPEIIEDKKIDWHLRAKFFKQFAVWVEKDGRRFHAIKAHTTPIEIFLFFKDQIEKQWKQ